jgi:hypothetical protein
LEIDVSQGRKLHFLVDSGADISLIKSYKLLETAEVEPKDRVRVKSAEGSVIETHGSIETRIREGEMDISFHFQLVDKQVDLKGDWILGRDFFKSMQTRICYKERSLNFRHAGCLMRKKLISLPELEREAHQGVGVGKLTLPARTELTVQLPASVGSRIEEGLVEKAEYNYEITYRRGSQSTNADALSRIGSVSKGGDLSNEFDEDRKKKILYEFHVSPVGGHRGMNKTYRAIKSQYFWPNMRREVEEYVKQCRNCQLNKTLTLNTRRLWR